VGNDGQLLVNFARLEETSLHIQSAIQALDSHLDRLETDAAPLVATWSGEARLAYQERQATWRQASAHLETLLRDIKRGLDQSIADYQHTERHNANLFR
jgi:WXG100 family type VII secretion target